MTTGGAVSTGVVIVDSLALQLLFLVYTEPTI